MKKTKCRLGAVILTGVMLLSVLFAGCSNKMMESSGVRGDNAAGNSMNSSPESGYDYSGDMGKQETADNTDVAYISSAPRKIIQTARMDMETEDTLALYQKLTAWASSNGGFEFSKNQYKSGDSIVMEATLKLPPEKLNSFFDFAAQSGTVINSNIDSQDITDSYYDVQTRLESKRKSLERYYELLKNTQTVEEIVTVQQSINQLTEEIEALEGKLKLWDSKVDYSDVHLFIREYSDPIKIKKDFDWNTMSFDDMLYMMKQGFLGVVNTVASCLQWVAIVLVSASPVLLPLLAVVLLIVYIAKYKKKKISKKEQENSDDKKE